MGYDENEEWLEMGKYKIILQGFLFFSNSELILNCTLKNVDFKLSILLHRE